MVSSSFPWQPEDSSVPQTIACLNFSGDLHLYHAGFRAGAQSLIEALERDGQHQVLLVYPLVYCLRHAVELALKMVIQEGHTLLKGSDDFPDGHQLHSLWSTAQPLLRQIFGYDEASYSQVAAIVESLRAIDPEGEAFRIPVTSKRNSNAGRRLPTIDPTLRHLDLRRVHDDVSDVLVLLDGAASRIDVYAGYKAELDAEYGAEQRRYQSEREAEMGSMYGEH